MDFQRYLKSLENKNFCTQLGSVSSVNGGVIKAKMPSVSIGSLCKLTHPKQKKEIKAEVVGFDDNFCYLMPYSSTFGVSQEFQLSLVDESPKVRVGNQLLGRVINGLGEPLDDLGPIHAFEEREIYARAKNPMARKIIHDPLPLGIRSIDSFLTIGKGQRAAILAGSGVGKSVLLGMIAKGATSDVNVITLLGERGREVKDFIEQILGREGLKKSVVIAVTSDQSPLIRMRGAFLATSIAEYFSDQGSDVLLFMDSLTRFAMAQREIGLSVGEPPTTKGYTPSVFYLLPQLLERAGSFEGKGSITGLYTVLVEGDDVNDPIGDTVRSIVDGHIVLSRDLAEKGHYPAIDILQSASRVMNQIVSLEHQDSARFLKELLAIYRSQEDLINIGAYHQGSNEKLDRYLAIQSEFEQLLQQSISDRTRFETTISHLMDLARND